ncbi:MAG TPA: hypothetical protein VD978_21235 [Azospirillum sp.]|nr:hypothetical protein [Azospirillum sp.]
MSQDRSIAGALPSDVELKRLRRKAEEMRVAYFRSVAQRLFATIGAGLPGSR